MKGNPPKATSPPLSAAERKALADKAKAKQRFQRQFIRCDTCDYQSDIKKLSYEEDQFYRVRYTGPYYKSHGRWVKPGDEKVYYCMSLSCIPRQFHRGLLQRLPPNERQQLCSQRFGEEQQEQQQIQIPAQAEQQQQQEHHREEEGWYDTDDDDEDQYNRRF
jgi:hypothetical protein